MAPGADVIGRVRLAKDASVWFGCVLRGDLNRIVIGEAANIQDGSILHVDGDAPCLIADHVHVGHHVNLHGCTVERGALIGIGAMGRSERSTRRNEWYRQAKETERGEKVDGKS